MRRFCWMIGFVLLFMACEKQKEILITDNTAPPDGTVSDVLLESYINRSYISLLGRKPEDAEFASGITTLRTNDLSQSDRENFVATVLGTPGYAQHVFDLSRQSLLNAVDTTEIRSEIFLFNLLLQDQQYQAIWPVITEEIIRMEALLAIPDDLDAGTIDVAEMHQRMVHNYIYDQINMGTSNFVTSVFLNLLLRNPTTAELNDAIVMVDGFTSTLFLEPGRSKEDFLTIFFASRNYAEGQVRSLYNRFLFQEPDTESLESLTLQFHADRDFEALITHILTTDLYVGL